ncbi:peroxiredoxin [Methylophilaceae bacterium]|nr:peroxiredoxin [Methylophilaceae bacterium]
MINLLNKEATSFVLMGSDSKYTSLKSFEGYWLVIFFYPKDDTPGCTKEACHFRDNYSLIKSMGASIIGISLDDSASHKKFTAKHNLPFILLSDPQGIVAEAYGALFKFFCIKLAKRHSFIIDPKGLIRKEYRSVNPLTHSNQIIEDLKVLQSQK